METLFQELMILTERDKRYKCSITLNSISMRTNSLELLKENYQKGGKSKNGLPQSTLMTLYQKRNDQF